MKIYKNSVCVTMSLDEFHDLLEKDLFEDLLTMIIELDEEHVDPIEQMMQDYDSNDFEVHHLDDMETFMQILNEAIGGEEGVFEGFTELEEEEQSEDRKVKRILDKYRDVDL